MKIGFDLDGTLDRPALRDLALTLIEAGWEVHIITGVFPEAGDWQSETAKIEKLKRLGIPYCHHSNRQYYSGEKSADLHVLYAVDHRDFNREYRLADLGLRKGSLCEQLGIPIFLDDSSIYAEMIPKMAGATTVLQVR